MREIIEVGQRFTDINGTIIMVTSVSDSIPPQSCTGAEVEYTIVESRFEGQVGQKHLSNAAALKNVDWAYIEYPDGTHELFT